VVGATGASTLVRLQPATSPGEGGKPKKLVINNVANKLLRILCGMAKNRQPYIESYQSVHPRLRKAGTRS